jgi:hypothetical protein
MDCKSCMCGSILLSIISFLFWPSGTVVFFVIIIQTAHFSDNIYDINMCYISSTKVLWSISSNEEQFSTNLFTSSCSDSSRYCIWSAEFIKSSELKIYEISSGGSRVAGHRRTYRNDEANSHFQNCFPKTAFYCLTT